MHVSILDKKKISEEDRKSRHSSLSLRFDSLFSISKYIFYEIVFIGNDKKETASQKRFIIFLFVLSILILMKAMAIQNFVKLASDLEKQELEVRKRIIRYLNYITYIRSIFSHSFCVSGS